MAKLRHGMMVPLILRQYGSNAYFRTSELKRNIPRRHNAIGVLHPRSIPPNLLTKMGAHLGAHGHGHIDACALLPSDLSVSTNLPQWFVEMAFAADEEPPIYLFELSETVPTSCISDYRSDGNHRTCSLGIGNNASLDALIKGYPSPALGTIAINLFWRLAARCAVVCRFGYVSTISNAAGPPSRLFDSPSGAIFPRLPGEAPPEFWEFSRFGGNSVGPPIRLTNAKTKRRRVLDGTGGGCGGLVTTGLCPPCSFLL